MNNALDLTRRDFWVGVVSMPFGSSPETTLGAFTGRKIFAGGVVFQNFTTTGINEKEKVGRFTGKRPCLTAEA